MTKDEALDLALEALELSSVTVDSFGVQRKTQEAITAIKQARALDKMAENARELGLDYEPAEVLGHNGWGFPIKAAAPVQKKCDCAAHSAADCVCGAWDKSAVAPVQEDWGPGPHECHSLTASVQEPVAWRVKNFYENAEGWFYADWHPDGLIPQIAELLYTTPPATPVQEPSGFFRHEDVCGDEVGPPTPYYLAPPNVATPLAAQRQSARSVWVGLTDEEVRKTISSVHIEPLFSYRHVARAIEAKLKEKNT